MQRNLLDLHHVRETCMEIFLFAYSKKEFCEKVAFSLHII